jgi:hypothetical protein
MKKEKKEKKSSFFHKSLAKTRTKDEKDTKEK